MSVFPRGSSRSKPPTPADSDVGVLIQYEDDSQALLGVVTGTKKERLIILNIRGRELELARARVHVFPGRIPSSLTTAKARTEYLEKLSRDAEDAAAKIELEELWSVAVEESRNYSVNELASLCFGKEDLLSCVALRTLLIREKVFFKRDKDDFAPRPAATVEDLKKAEIVKQKKHRLKEQTIQIFRERIKNPKLSLPDEIMENIILLEDTAASVHGMDPGRQKEAKELIQMCFQALNLPDIGHPNERAFAILEKIGHFNRDTNLPFIRYGIPTIFPAEVVAQADTLPLKDAYKREDLIKLECVTIDDVSTRDMDDALSLEYVGNAYRLGIHITDVGSFIPNGSALDSEARRRATSIYAADRTVNMLPEGLAENGFSLIEGAERPCLSTIFELDEQFEIKSYRVASTIIKSAKRLTYDEVDEALEREDRLLCDLYAIAAGWEARRLHSGAMRVQKREVVPFLRESGKIELLEIDETSPSRMLVSEMMVLANAHLAEFCAANKIPVLFRGQERPDDDQLESDQGVPEGPAKDFAARGKLKKSTTGFSPMRHAGLGLDAYLQATSPIRRYMDLCHQQQVLSFLRDGKPHYTQSEMETITAQVEENLQAAGAASKETRRYWLLRYLEQRDRKTTITGTVVRTDLKTPLVELDEVYATFFCKGKKELKVGDVIQVKIASIDPRNDYIKLEEA